MGLPTGRTDFHLVRDCLGSVVALVNTAGTVVARYTYDPYGSTVTADESGLSRPNIVRYIGGALDQTTGLTKLGQRYYNPALRAFTQQNADQLLANPQNGNLYSYAAPSPSTFIDPTARDLCQYRPLMCGITSWEEPIAGGPGCQKSAVGLVAGIIFAFVPFVGEAGIALPSVASKVGVSLYGGLRAGFGTIIWACQ